MTYLRGVLIFESKLEIVYNLSSPVQCWALPYCAGTNPNSFVPSTLGNTFKIMNTAKTAPKSTNFILKIFNNADSFKNWTTSYFSRRGWVLEIFEDETSYALLHGITDKLSNSYVKLMWTNFFKLFVPLICTYLGHQGRFLADKAAIVAATSSARCRHHMMKFDAQIWYSLHNPWPERILRSKSSK